MPRPKPAPAPTVQAQRQRGLTLVELMVMLLVIGMLAAVALPKYADVQMRARIAKLKTTAQQVQVVNGLVRATAVSRRQDCQDPTPNQVTVDDLNIALVHCLPQALGSFEHGVLAAARLTTADGWQLSLSGGQAGGAHAGATVAVELADAPLPAHCALLYTAAAAATPPQVLVRSSGC